MLHYSIAKSTSKKIGALIRSMKFLSPEVALYLYKSTIRLCMEYYCHVWASAPSYYLELSGKLPKRIFRTVGPSLATFLELLAHRRNVAILSLFYKYYFGRCSFESQFKIIVNAFKPLTIVAELCIVDVCISPG